MLSLLPMSTGPRHGNICSAAIPPDDLVPRVKREMMKSGADRRPTPSRPCDRRSLGLRRAVTPATDGTAVMAQAAPRHLRPYPPTHPTPHPPLSA